MIDRLTNAAYRQEDKAKLEKSITEIVRAEAAELRQHAVAYRLAAETLPDSNCTAQVIAAGVDGSGRVNVDLMLHGPDGSVLGYVTIWPSDPAVSVDAARLLFRLSGLRFLVEPVMP